MIRLTIFLGSFLTFLVQPLIGNALLPAFGGTASVWSFCLASFQLLLVGGYFYAERLGGNASAGSIRLHLALVFAAAAWFVAAGFGYRGVAASLGGLPPALGAAACVALLVAVPYVVLSSNSTLVQSLAGGRYGLYAVSNLGSFAGLFAYPFVFEPRLPLRLQWFALAALTAVYGVLLLRLVRSRRDGTAAAAGPAPAPSAAPFRPFAYFALSFISCYLLNAVSTHLCMDITPLPLMWTVILGVYLLSYVAAFSDRWSRQRRWLTVLVSLLAVYASLRLSLIGSGNYPVELATGLLVLFLGGWLVHSRLYLMRPAADRLGRYYLLIALGGAAGGAVCSFVMPLVSVTVAEYPVAMAMIVGVACGAVSSGGWIRKTLLSLAVVLFALFGVVLAHTVRGTPLARYRNAYGTGAVVRRPVRLANGSQYMVHDFLCNATTHGLQMLGEKGLSYEPTAYFIESAGGLAIVRHPKYVAGKPLRVGVCGMGMGTLAAYARPGDLYRMYEINPAVRELALNPRMFTFIGEAKGRVEIVVDDARKALERERAAGEEKFDVLYIDVFNGDSIPPHMGTREAYGLYRDRLAPGGVLAIQVTNWHLDLLPMVKAEAKEIGFEIVALDCLPNSRSAGSRWTFLAAPSAEGAEAFPLSTLYDPRHHRLIPSASIRDLPVMTDDFHPLLPYLRF